jgi:hypothetical protein
MKIYELNKTNFKVVNTYIGEYCVGISLTQYVSNKQRNHSSHVPQPWSSDKEEEY